MKMSLKNPNTLGAIRKGCPQFRGGSGVQAEVDTNADRGRGWLAKCGRSLGKKSSYHICEIYSDNLAVCLYIKFSSCLY